MRCQTDSIAAALDVIAKQLHTPVVANRAAKNFFRAAQIFSRERTYKHGAIYPSALCRCMRQAGMDLCPDLPRFPEDTPENVRRAGVIGDLLHDHIQTSFELAAKRSGIFTFKREVQVTPKTNEIARQLNMRLRADGEITYENLRLGVEIKGVGEQTFASMHEPSEEHKLQTAPYQKLLGWDATWFIYVSRRTFVDRPFVIRIPDHYWEMMKNRALVVLEHHLHEMLPPGPRQGEACRWCPYERFCPHPRTKSVSQREVFQRAAAVQGQV